MTSRRDFLTQKYGEMQEALKEFLPDRGLFPPLDDLDLTDMLYFLKSSFVPEGDNRPVVRQLMKLRNITMDADRFEQVYLIVEGFIGQFKNMPT